MSGVMHGLLVVDSFRIYRKDACLLGDRYGGPYRWVALVVVIMVVIMVVMLVVIPEGGGLSSM